MSKEENKTPIHLFACDVFPRRLWIVKQPPKGWLKNHFKHLNGKEEEDLLEHTIEEAKAVTYQDVYHPKSGSYGILVVILDDTMSVSDCAHEATHFAMGIYAAIGEEINVEYQEVLAYLVGYGTDCIYQVLKDEYKPMFDGSHEI